MQRETIWNGVTMIAVLCALVTTGLVIRREVFPSPGSSQGNARDIPNWASYTADGNAIGDKAAPVKIVVFADYECPACRVFALETWPAIRRLYRDQVVLIVRNWPLSYHKHARAAARAAECAADQQSFEPFHDLLYHKQDSLGVNAFRDLAIESGVTDIVAFEACLADESTDRKISSDIAAARSLDGQFTPTVMVNGTLLSSPPDSLELEDLVRSSLRSAKSIGKR